MLDVVCKYCIIKITILLSSFRKSISLLFHTIHSETLDKMHLMGIKPGNVYLSCTVQYNYKCVF